MHYPVFRLVGCLSEANAASSSGLESEVLGVSGGTFLKSAMWVAYCEGVRFRLGGSPNCPQEDSPGKCSSLIN